MDPVTLAVVRGSFEQIADEMDLHLIHAAISPIISETNDCANGIFHPRTGETIAQGRYGLPVFLAYMQFAVQNVIERGAGATAASSRATSGSSTTPTSAAATSRTCSSSRRISSTASCSR